MATFHPNPSAEVEPWSERAAGDDLGFRVWHLIFFCLSGMAVLVILVCCCVKIRVPRTKQEIEADYQRKKIATKFRQKLKLIHNQDMDAMDLRRALEIIQEDLRQENKNIEEQLSLTRYPAADYISPEEGPKTVQSCMKAEPQQPTGGGIASRMASLLRANKLRQKEALNQSVA